MSLLRIATLINQHQGRNDTTFSLSKPLNEAEKMDVLGMYFASKTLTQEGQILTRLQALQKILAFTEKHDAARGSKRLDSIMLKDLPSEYSRFFYYDYGRDQLKRWSQFQYLLEHLSLRDTPFDSSIAFLVREILVNINDHSYTMLNGNYFPKNVKGVSIKYGKRKLKIELYDAGLGMASYFLKAPHDQLSVTQRLEAIQKSFQDGATTKIAQSRGYGLSEVTSSVCRFDGNLELITNGLHLKLDPQTKKFDIIRERPTIKYGSYFKISFPLI